MYAEGSTTGAGGIGTTSPEPAEAPLPVPSQPQAGAGAAQLGAAQLGAAAAQPQPLLQPLPQPHLLWQQENSRSRLHVWQHLLQPLPQLLQQRPQCDLQHELEQQLVSQPQPL